MAIIYSYPTVLPSVNDLVLGTDVDKSGKPTKNFTVQSLVDLVAGGAAGLGAVLTISNNAQDATGGNQSAVNFLNVQGSGTATFSAFSDGTMNITGGTGTGFTSFQSTSFTGKLDVNSFNQDNIRTLGILTSLKVGNATPAVTSIKTVMVSPGSDLALVTEKAIATYVDGKIENQDTLAELLAKNPSPAANPSNTTGGTDILVSATDDITFTDTSKIILGTGSDATIEHDGTDLKIVNTSGKTTISNSSGNIDISATAVDKKTNLNGKAGVELQFDTAPKLEVLNTGVKVTGTVSAAVGTKELPSYTFTGDVDTGMFHPAEHEIGFSTEQVLRLKVSNSGINVTGAIDATSSIEGLSFTTDTTTSSTKITRFVLDTDPADPQTTPTTFGLFVTALVNNTMVPTTKAVKTYVDSVAGSKTLSYQADAAGVGTMPFTLNLSTDSLDIAGGTNMNTSTLAVDTNLGVVTVNLDDNVTLPTATNLKGVFTGKKYADAVMNIEAGVGEDFISITTTPNAAQPPGAANVNGFFGPLRASDASTNIAAGVADKAVELTVAGDISPVDDVISYPATTGTVKVQAAAGVAVAFEDDAGKNLSIVYPVIGQEVSGTSIVADTKVASISGGNLVLDKATSTALVAGAALSFAASDLDVYTSGGNVRMPSFIPSTVATGKYLTNLPTPTSSQILSTDSILSGMAKLQGQITSTTGLAYEGAWRASVTAVANAAVDGSVDLVIVTADANLVKGTVVEGAGITGTVRIDDITGTAITLDTAITIETGITLTMSPPGGAITGAVAGTAASLTTPANKLNGRFYICDTVGKAEPNAAVPWAAATTPNEWAVGDWVIYVSNGAATDGWQKLDQSNEIFGSGAATKIAKWTSSNTLGTGLISDDTNTVTIGASGTGDFLVEGGTTLGGGATKNTLISGDLKVNKELNIMEGLGVPLSDGADPPSFPINYGSAGQALFSGGAAATANIWKTVEWTITDGSAAGTSTVSNGNTVTFAATGGLATGESSKTVTYEIDYLGTNNAILTAAEATEAILTTDQIWFNDVATLEPATINKIKQAPISSLPFDSYDKWILRGDNYDAADAATSQDVDSEEVMTAAGGTIISTVVGATRKVTINHGDLTVTQTDNTGTPLTPDFGGAIELVASASGTDQGHMDTVVTNEITLPSPVNFTAGSVPGATAAAGTAGYVPAPIAGSGTTSFFLNGIGGFTIPPNDDGVTAVTATAPIASTGGDTPVISHNNVLTDEGGTAGTYTMADVTVDAKGHITGIADGHGGGGGGIKKGGIFTKLFTTASGATNRAFTIVRATSGAMVFDVMMTSDTSDACSIAKKFTVVKQFGVDPIVFKILDTGPDFSSADPPVGTDFTVAFTQHTTDTSIKCVITPITLGVQTIGITINLGFGEHDATVVMNASSA